MPNKSQLKMARWIIIGWLFAAISAGSNIVNAADYQSHSENDSVELVTISDDNDIEWFYDGEFWLLQNENIGNAQRDRDIIQDSAGGINLAIAMNKVFESEKAITLRAYIESEEFQEVTDLSRESVGGQLIYRWQNQYGFSAPFYQFNIGYQTDEFEGEQRDSDQLRSQLFFTKRLTDQTTLTSGVEYQRRDSDGSVFDLTQQRIFANLDYNFTQDTTGYLSYSYADGEISSTAQSRFCNGADALDIFGLLTWSTAVEDDDAFNQAFAIDDCAEAHWLSYRLNAITQTLTVGINVGLNNSWSLDISALLVDVKAEGNNQYDTSVFRASLLMRF